MTEQSPYGQVPPNQAPYGQAPEVPFVPQPKRPPLTPQQRRGAMIAGGVGFTLMTIGFGLISITLFVLVIFGILGLVGTAMAQSGGTMDVFIDGVNDFVQGFWWVALVVLLLGVVLWLVGYFASVRILRSSGNPRATAITWAGLGIAVSANWIVGFVLSIPANILTSLPSDELMTSGVVVGGFFGLMGLLVAVAIGVTAWWWMAHAFRPALEPDAAGAPRS